MDPKHEGRDGREDRTKEESFDWSKEDERGHDETVPVVLVVKERERREKIE